MTGCAFDFFISFELRPPPHSASALQLLDTNPTQSERQPLFLESVGVSVFLWVTFDLCREECAQVAPVMGSVNKTVDGGEEEEVEEEEGVQGLCGETHS